MKYVDLKGNYLDVIQFRKDNLEEVKKFIEDEYTFMDSDEDIVYSDEYSDMWELTDPIGDKVCVFIGDYFIKDPFNGVMYPLEKDTFESLVVMIPENTLDRLLIEYGDLLKRMRILDKALLDEECAGLYIHPKEKELMIKYINCMQEYKEILEKRIAFCKK